METPWANCTTCGEYRPVFVRFEPDGAPYCRGCGAHRMELEVFPAALEDVPIVDATQDDPPE